MDLIDDLYDRFFQPFNRRKAAKHIERGRHNRVDELADEHGIDQEFIDDRARQRFNELLGYTTKDQAAYARDMGLDRDWAREEAIDWIERYLDQADRGDMTRDRRIGHHMEVFDIQEDEIDGADDISFHIYVPDRTASEELADAILAYRTKEHLDRYSDIDGPRYAYADPDAVRDRIEERADDENPEEFQTDLEEWYDGSAATDVYERLGIGWATTEELDAYIDSFWEPADPVELTSIALTTDD